MNSGNGKKKKGGSAKYGRNRAKGEAYRRREARGETPKARRREREVEKEVYFSTIRTPKARIAFEAKRNADYARRVAELRDYGIRVIA